jgi:hypothetical protein
MLRFSDNASFQNERDNSFSLEFVSVPTIHDGRIEKLKSLTEGAVNNHDKHNLQLSISSHPVSANQEYGASASYYTTTSSLPAFMDKQQLDFSSITSSHPKFGDLNHGESFYISYIRKEFLTPHIVIEMLRIEQQQRKYASKAA